MKKTKKKEFSVTQWARRMKISRQAVIKQIHAGKLRATKVGNSFIIKVK